MGFLFGDDLCIEYKLYIDVNVSAGTYITAAVHYHKVRSFQTVQIFVTWNIMKWKTHIVMVGNKCGTLWKGDTSAVLWVRDILKARPRVQSV